MSDKAASMAKEAPAPFGQVHVVEPTIKHTHTIILLHGRGSTGEEFADELAESLMSNNKTLMEAFPSWKWVFPSSRELWSTVFEEHMPAWFEAHSLTDVTARQDLQMEGIRDSVKYLQGVVESEIDMLSLSASHLVLGGISQGAAIGMWTILCTRSTTPLKSPSAFVGASTWLPFAINIDRAFNKGFDHLKNSESEADRFVKEMMAPPAQKARPIPVFLGHGIDDAYVDVELGQHARDVLIQAGLAVHWKEYSGADQEGHWLKAPEEVDDIASFLQEWAAGKP